MPESGFLERGRPLANAMRAIEVRANNAQHHLDDIEQRARNGDADAVTELTKTEAQLQAEGHSEEWITRLHGVRDKVFPPVPPPPRLEDTIMASAKIANAAAQAAADAAADAAAALLPPDEVKVPGVYLCPPTDGMSNDDLGQLGPSDRIRLAWSDPDEYLKANRNIYEMDVHRQSVTLQTNPWFDPNSTHLIPVMEETPQTTPLLVWAIENGFLEDVVRDIAQVYKANFAPGLDSIWGVYARNIRAPLASAVKFGRFDVIPILLNAGANPRIRCAELDPASTFGAIEPCVRRGVPHTQCVRNGQDTDDRMCDDPLRAGLRTMRYARYGERVRLCVEALIAHGGRIDILATASATTDEFKWAVDLGFNSLVINSMRDIMILPDGDQKKTDFVALLDQILKEVLLGQPDLPDNTPNPINRDGGLDDIIDYLLSIGAKPQPGVDGMPFADVLWHHADCRPMNSASLRKVLIQGGLDDFGN